MAEQWDPPTGESRGPGGPGPNRNALQATLADLVRAADGPGAAPPAASPSPGGGQPVVPGGPVPAPTAGPRPLRGPSAGRPVFDFDEDEPGAAPGAPVAGAPVAGGPVPGSAVPGGPVPGSAVPRPQASGRPKLPFGPEQVPGGTGNGSGGAVRPGSGAGGFNPSVAPTITSAGGGSGSFGSGMGGGMGGGTIGAGSLSGRITPGDLGDNLARLTPTPTEQPTIPLRKRRPGEDAKADQPDKAPPPPSAATPPPQPKPVVAIEAWSPHYDDILPQRPSRSGRSFRRAR